MLIIILKFSTLIHDCLKPALFWLFYQAYTCIFSNSVCNGVESFISYPLCSFVLAATKESYYYICCCSIIETLETGLEHILLVVKLTLGGFDESVPESSEWCHIVSYRGIGVTGIPQI